jgi:hypothetical protein
MVAVQRGDSTSSTSGIYTANVTAGSVAWSAPRNMVSMNGAWQRCVILLPKAWAAQLAGYLARISAAYSNCICDSSFERNMLVSPSTAATRAAGLAPMLQQRCLRV